MVAVTNDNAWRLRVRCYRSCYPMMWLLSPVLAAVATAGGPPSQPLRLDRLRASLAALQDRATSLAGKNNLIDTLHFGWFDRPYARSTLAIVVKTTYVLEREVVRREHGNAAMADQTLRHVFQWADEALERIARLAPDSSFRPHRLRITGRDLIARATIPPLFAFVDAATTTRYHETFGDLDLLTAMGQRVYALPAQAVHDRGSIQLLAARARDLGMATLALTLSTSHNSPGADPGPVTTGPIVTVRGITLGQLLAGGPNLKRDNGFVVGITDASGHESWSASLARRALARGVLSGDRFVVAGWNPPVTGDGRPAPTSAVAAAMWVHAIEGQKLGLVPGWRDLRDGSSSPHPSIFLDPKRAETMALTALDLLRFGGELKSLSPQPILALAVGPEAVDVGDDNLWASWVGPIWSGLLARQIQFDLVNVETASGNWPRRYRVVFPLRRDESGDADSVLLRIERTLATYRQHVHRLSARELNGSIAVDVFVRRGRIDAQEYIVAVVNLSDRPRTLKLRGGPRLDKVRDLLNGEWIHQPSELMPLAPWQVRLLRPDL